MCVVRSCLLVVCCLSYAVCNLVCVVCCLVCNMLRFVAWLLCVAFVLFGVRCFVFGCCVL